MGLRHGGQEFKNFRLLIADFRLQGHVEGDRRARQTAKQWASGRFAGICSLFN
jgi:hypothetical protein